MTNQAPIASVKRAVNSSLARRCHPVPVSTVAGPYCAGESIHGQEDPHQLQRWLDQRVNRGWSTRTSAGRGTPRPTDKDGTSDSRDACAREVRNHHGPVRYAFWYDHAPDGWNSGQSHDGFYDEVNSEQPRAYPHPIVACHQHLDTASLRRLTMRLRGGRKPKAEGHPSAGAGSRSRLLGSTSVRVVVARGDQDRVVSSNAAHKGTRSSSRPFGHRDRSTEGARVVSGTRIPSPEPCTFLGRPTPPRGKIDSALH
jgi:hypothetical protein